MKARGFTLIEVLIALAIMAFITLATHQIFDSATRAKNLSEETLGELSRLQLVFRVMEQDFSQVTKRKVRNEAGDTQDRYLMHERYLFDSEYDGIAFVRSGWTNPGNLLPRSELQAVAYRVQEGSLQRLYRLYVDQLDGIEPRVQTLLEHVSELKFEFYNSESPQEKWLSQWQKETLPVAVAVEITLEDERVLRRSFLLAGQGDGDAAGGQNGQP